MTNPSAPKKFDAVTIIGMAVGIAILFYGTKINNDRQVAAQKAADQAAQDDADRKQAAKVRADAIAAAAGAQNSNPKAPAPEGAPEKAKAPVKAAETPDISVTGDLVEVVFCSRGAALKSAKLPGVDEDASKKDHKGLEILTEIVDGKRAFGMPKIEIITTRGAKLQLDGKSGLDSLDESIWVPKDSGSFDASGARTIAYELQLQGDYTLTKTFTIYKTERFVRCDVKLENHSQNDIETYNYELNGPQGILLDGPPADPKSGAGNRVTVQAQLAARPSAETGVSSAEPDVKLVSTDAAKAENEDNRSQTLGENLWGAVKNRFFMATFVSLDAPQLIRIMATPIVNNDKPDDKRFSEPNIGLFGRRRNKSVNKGTAQNDPYALYLGPADDHHLDVAEAAMKKMMPAPADYHMRLSIQFFDSFGWRWPRVDWIARQMMWVFQGIQKQFGNFGIAVVLMTVLIKMCLHPLTRKTMLSMSKMQKLQPELNKIKKKYENQTSTEAKMKMTAEQQEVMRKAGVNPAAGCLPMFIQIPVFSALYGIFNHAFDMRGAEFLWIKDLSRPDNLATLSFWPHTINLLPILYSILSIVQTQLTPQTKSDDPQQEMNRKMMMFMPVVFSLMFYTMPAGLVLYFAVSALWGMSENWYIRKFLIKDTNTPGGPKTPTDGLTVAKVAR